MQRRIERLAVLGSGLLLLGASVGFVMLIRPAPAWTPPPVNLNVPATAADGPRPATSLSDLAIIWQRDLRQELYDAPAAPPPSVQREPALAIQLVGTVVEAEHRFGVFRLPDQTTVVKPVGADIAGYSILAIDRGRASLRHGQRDYELTVPWYDRIPRPEPADVR